MATEPRSVSPTPLVACVKHVTTPAIARYNIKNICLRCALGIKSADDIKFFPGHPACMNDEENAATIRCEDCHTDQYLCGFCYTVAHKRQSRKDHARASINREFICEEDETSVAVEYCSTTNQMLCRQCLDAHTIGHNHIKISSLERAAAMDNTAQQATEAEQADGIPPAPMPAPALPMGFGDTDDAPMVQLEQLQAYLRSRKLVRGAKIGIAESQLCEFKGYEERGTANVLQPVTNISFTTLDSECRREICAFLNSHGGLLLKGVTDSGVIHGYRVENLDSLALKLYAKVFSNFLPRPTDPQGQATGDASVWQYSLWPLPVYETATSEKPIPDVYVIGIVVPQAERRRMQADYFKEGNGSIYIRQGTSAVRKWAPRIHAVNAPPRDWVGRNEILEALCSAENGLVLNNDAKTLILTGPAGIGKTALALKIAEQCFKYYGVKGEGRGVLFIDGNRRQSNAIIQKILEQLDPFGGVNNLLSEAANSDRTDGLKQLLQNALCIPRLYKLLIIVDDVWVWDQVALLAALLPKRCRLIVTSGRTATKMGVPAEFECQEVFVDRLPVEHACQLLHMPPDTDAETTQKFADICCYTPGALRRAGEWCASRRDTTVTPGMLLQFFQDEMVKLVDDPTTRAAFASDLALYERLLLDEQRLLCALSLLHGPFSLELAKQVIGDDVNVDITMQALLAVHFLVRRGDGQLMPVSPRLFDSPRLLADRQHSQQIAALSTALRVPGTSTGLPPNVHTLSTSPPRRVSCSPRRRVSPGRQVSPQRRLISPDRRDASSAADRPVSVSPPRAGRTHIATVATLHEKSQQVSVPPDTGLGELGHAPSMPIHLNSLVHQFAQVHSEPIARSISPLSFIDEDAPSPPASPLIINQSPIVPQVIEFEWNQHLDRLFFAKMLTHRQPEDFRNRVQSRFVTLLSSQMRDVGKLFQTDAATATAQFDAVASNFRSAVNVAQGMQLLKLVSQCVDVIDQHLEIGTLVDIYSRCAVTAKQCGEEVIQGRFVWWLSSAYMRLDVHMEQQERAEQLADEAVALLKPAAVREAVAAARASRLGSPRLQIEQPAGADDAASADGQPQIALNAAFEYGSALFQKGRLTRSHHDYQSALPILFESLRWLPRQHIRYAQAQLTLGVVFAALKQYREALSAYKTAQELLPHDHPSQITLINNIGSVYFNQGDYTHALEKFRQALQHTEDVNDLANAAASHNNIGMVLLQQGFYPQAEAEFQQALDIQTRCLVPNHPDVGGTHYNIGQSHLKQQHYDQAIVEFTHALRIKQSCFGERNPGLCSTLSSIADCYYRNGDLKPALQFYQRVFEILRVKGEDARQLYEVNRRLAMIGRKVCSRNDPCWCDSGAKFKSCHGRDGGK
eukprot:TRINITY_DN6875_c0_g1_i1.p1 TRINITY_DN6875_c0_g1~~TRINITY_DN6875_c0_g1_i1.p1  ORF type:complete len:1367 (+),score=323.96 TRINITY_DN6875_c0_g1_i1:62-4162(+)